MIDRLSEIAHAKLNLALHVRSRDADGYHAIETLFVFTAAGDGLTAHADDGLHLTVTGPFADALAGEDDNLILRAARAIQARFGISRGAAMALEKNLPVASGIGGGSADAAAAIRLLACLWDIPAGEPGLMEVARSLGADVPACLLSSPCLGTGRGDALQPLDDLGLAGLPVLLVNPRVPVPTGPVFARWDGTDRGPLAVGSSVIDSALAGRNDLELPARQIAPVIDDVLAALREGQGVRLARMSGSGATCFALYETPAARDDAFARIAAQQPGWWSLATTLR